MNEQIAHRIRLQGNPSFGGEGRADETPYLSSSPETPGGILDSSSRNMIITSKMMGGLQLQTRACGSDRRRNCKILHHAENPPEIFISIIVLYLIHKIIIYLQHEMGDQPARQDDITCMNKLNRGMHISQRNGNEGTRVTALPRS